MRWNWLGYSTHSMTRLAVGLAAALLAACAPQQKVSVAPSTAGVRADIESAKTSINNAAAKIEAAGGNADKLRALADQADRKNVLLKRWWELHQ